MGRRVHDPIGDHGGERATDRAVAREMANEARDRRRDRVGCRGLRRLDADPSGRLTVGEVDQRRLDAAAADVDANERGRAGPGSHAR